MTKAEALAAQAVKEAIWMIAKYRTGTAKMLFNAVSIERAVKRAVLLINGDFEGEEAPRNLEMPVYLNDFQVEPLRHGIDGNESVNLAVSLLFGDPRKAGEENQARFGLRLARHNRVGDMAMGICGLGKKITDYFNFKEIENP